MPVMRLHFNEIDNAGCLDAYAAGLRGCGVGVIGGGLRMSPDDGTCWLDVEYPAGTWPEVAARLRGILAVDFRSQQDPPVSDSTELAGTAAR